MLLGVLELSCISHLNGDASLSFQLHEVHSSTNIVPPPNREQLRKKVNKKIPAK